VTKLTLLGCGGSAGVPLIIGDWGACNPNVPQNRRTRTSLMIETTRGEVWLIDSGPDVRQQLLRENVRRVDGVFLTHAHFDHIMGLDDLRVFAFRQKQKIPLYADAVTLSLVRKTFPHLVDDLGETLALSPQDKKIFRPLLITPKMRWQGETVTAFMQKHSTLRSVGYRFGKWAYSTDVAELSDDQLKALQGLDVWFVEAFSQNPSAMYTQPSPKRFHGLRPLAPNVPSLFIWVPHLIMKA
jgi:phosphoribosyl 1,2-cyclic phosphate phosphodiesterase